MSWFEENEKLKVKDSEVLRVTLYDKGGEKPRFAITESISGVFTLYSVDGVKLQKLKTGNDPRALERSI